MLSITNHQGNENENHSEISFHICQKAIIKKNINNRCWWGCGEKGALTNCWWESNLVQQLWKTLRWWWFSHQVVSNSFDPVDCGPLGSTVHGLLQAGILEWVVAISFSRGSSQARNRTWVSWIAGRWFTDWATKNRSTIWPRNFPSAYTYVQKSKALI